MTESTTPNPEGEEKDISIDDCTELFPETPFKTIGLTFSGGGFRAASFSLGVLSYLHRINYNDKPLLESVKFITSTSGGSITNGAYCVNLYSDKPNEFQQFYDSLREQMSGETMLKKVFELLEDESVWKEQGTLTNQDGSTSVVKKQRNLINAFAKTYDQLLYKQATLGNIADHFKGSSARKPHLQEVCFNTTEFNNGLNFYFQVNGNEHMVRKRGNGYLKFKDFQAVRGLKISDIVAASSCFPSGFEPIIYPNDFVHERATDVNALLNAVEYGHNTGSRQHAVLNQPFSLMDGGIADNMGLHSIMIEDSNRRKYPKPEKPTFDLILSCDVTSYFNDPLEGPGRLKGGLAKKISIRSIITFFMLSNVVLMLAAASIVFKKIPEAGYLLLIPSLFFSIIYWIAFVKLRKAKKKTGGVGAMALKYLVYFEKLPLADLWPLISARLNSSLKLVSDLFLKQIRRIQYNSLFEKPVMKERAISCLVYEFSTAHIPRRLENLVIRDSAWWPDMKVILTPTTTLQAMVDEARVMGTTLWFAEGEKDKKDKLIATGQLTTCYSLIKHIKRLQCLGDRYAKDDSLNKLLVTLLEDWACFQAKPMFMISDLKAKS